MKKNVKEKKKSTTSLVRERPLLGDALSCCLLVLDVTETTDGAADRNSRGGRHDVRATSNHLAAATALPDAGRSATHRRLAAERADVLGVLRDLSLLRDLTQRRTIAGAVLAHDANLLGPLRHLSVPTRKKKTNKKQTKSTRTKKGKEKKKKKGNQKDRKRELVILFGFKKPVMKSAIKQKYLMMSLL